MLCKHCNRTKSGNLSFYIYQNKNRLERALGAVLSGFLLVVLMFFLGDSKKEGLVPSFFHRPLSILLFLRLIREILEECGMAVSKLLRVYLALRESNLTERLHRIQHRVVSTLNRGRVIV